MQPKKDPKTKKLFARREKLAAELAQFGNLVHGSWVERFSICSNPECPCRRDKAKRHGPRAYVVVNRQGKQQPKYVSNSQKAAVREGIKQYKRLLDLAERISQVNLLLMRAKALSNETGKTEQPDQENDESFGQTAPPPANSRRK